MFEKPEIIEYNESLKKEYVMFKKEFLQDIWSDKYEEFMLNNFSLIKNNKLFLLILKNKIIGTILINFNDNIIYIEELEITKRQRKKGYGKSLIQYLITNYSNFFIELIVDKDNVNAINFYNKFGFEIIEDNKSTYKMKYDKHLKQIAA